MADDVVLSAGAPGPRDVPGACWYWRNREREGAAVVVDLDGVLSDAAGRQHFLSQAKPDWEAFFDACGEDPPVEEVGALVKLLAPELVVVLLTARPARTAGRTLDWLSRHDLRWDLLVMRRDGDYRPAATFKREAARLLRSRAIEPKLCLEDDVRNVEMFRAEGMPTLYLHSGYYERR